MGWAKKVEKLDYPLSESVKQVLVVDEPQIKSFNASLHVQTK